MAGLLNLVCRRGSILKSTGGDCVFSGIRFDNSLIGLCRDFTYKLLNWWGLTYTCACMCVNLSTDRF